MSETTSDNLKAQFGEDRLLAEHFGNKPEGFFVEVGAYDGVDFSNSYYFEKLGWHGILVEADPDLAERCRQSRPGSQVVNCAVVGPDSPASVTFEVVDGWKALSSLKVRQSLHGETLPNELKVREITVPAGTLDQVLDQCSAPGIDFITIDVEGEEWGVLAGFNISNWRPQVAIVERSTTVPDRRILNYMHDNGYHYLRTTGGINDWFVLSQQKPGLLYGIRLFLCLILPSLMLAHVLYPLRRVCKSLLSRLGLLEAARSVTGRIGSKF